MADGLVIVAPDSTGKQLQTYSNTVSAQTVHSQAVVLTDKLGIPLHRPATYIVSVSAQANTASSDSIAIEAPASGIIRIRRVMILNPGTATAAAFRNVQLIRTTAAGTAGAVTPAPIDASDSAYGGICRAKPTSLGTAGTVLLTLPVWVPTTAANFTPIIIDFDQGNLTKPPLVTAGTANGISLRDPGASGGANFAAAIIFTVE